MVNLLCYVHAKGEQMKSNRYTSRTKNVKGEGDEVGE